MFIKANRDDLVEKVVAEIAIVEKYLPTQLTEEEIEHLNLDAKLKNKLSKNVKEIAIPKLNFVISSYYKGTGLEEVLKKLEKYLDTADVNESDITNI